MHCRVFSSILSLLDIRYLSPVPFPDTAKCPLEAKKKKKKKSFLAFENHLLRVKLRNLHF